MFTDDGAPRRREIVALEERIEGLEETLTSCAKFALAARVTVIGGSVLLAALFLNAIMFRPGLLIAALAAVIGGIVLRGTNNATARETRAALRDAQDERAALIADLAPRIVEGNEAPLAP